MGWDGSRGGGRGDLVRWGVDGEGAVVAERITFTGLELRFRHGKEDTGAVSTCSR